MRNIIIVILILLITECVSPEIQTEETTTSEQTSELIQKNDPEFAEHHKITAEEAKKIMDSGEEYTLLDVRTDAEYNEGHIEGAILIPDYEIKDRAESELPDKTALILIYCRSGRRSANVAYELAAMGYTKVYDFGGIIDWGYGTVE